MYNPIKILVILYPKSLTNLVVDVRTRHSHQILLIKTVGLYVHLINMIDRASLVFCMLTFTKQIIQICKYNLIFFGHIHHFSISSGRFFHQLYFNFFSSFSPTVFWFDLIPSIHRFNLSYFTTKIYFISCFIINRFLEPELISSFTGFRVHVRHCYSETACNRWTLRTK